MRSPANVLVGAQRPRLETHCPGTSSSGAEVVALGKALGFIADDWQEYAFDVGLREQANGNWSHRTVVLIVPRQNGKTAMLALLLVAAVTVLGYTEVAYSSQDFGRTTMELVDTVQAMFEHPKLKGLVEHHYRANGRVGFTLRNGAKIRFIARSTGGGRGLRNELVIYDEGYALKPEHIAAMLPTMSTVPNPQTWVVSSAPLPGSDELHRLRRLGQTGGKGLAYMEWSADPEDDPENVETWARANPALGTRISVDHVAHEMATMVLADFLVERLGVPSDDAGPDVVKLADWLGLVDVSSATGRQLAFALDAMADGSFAALSVASRRADGTVHVETVEHQAGLEWVVDRVTSVTQGRPAALDPLSCAGQFVAPLEARGVTVVTMGRPEIGRACASFLSAVKESTLRHLGQSSLTRAVPMARRKEIGDYWVWTPVSPLADISPLRAATMAHWQIAAMPKRSGSLVL